MEKRELLKLLYQYTHISDIDANDIPFFANVEYVMSILDGVEQEELIDIARNSGYRIAIARGEEFEDLLIIAKGCGDDKIVDFYEDTMNETPEIEHLYEGKKQVNKPELDEKKKKEQGEMGWFMKFNAGDVEKGIDIFNSSVDSDAMSTDGALSEDIDEKDYQVIMSITTNEEDLDEFEVEDRYNVALEKIMDKYDNADHLTIECTTKDKEPERFNIAYNDLVDYVVNKNNMSLVQFTNDNYGFIDDNDNIIEIVGKAEELDEDYTKPREYITLPKDAQQEFERLMSEKGWELDDETSVYGSKNFYDSFLPGDAQDIHYQFITRDKLTKDEFSTKMDELFDFIEEFGNNYDTFITCSGGLIGDGSEYDSRGTVGLDIHAIEVSPEGEDNVIPTNNNQSLRLKDGKPIRQQDKDILKDIKDKGFDISSIWDVNDEDEN